MRILVTGATGTVGRHVVDDLLTAGVSVRALSRRSDHSGLPDGVEVVRGDLDEPGSLAPAFAGVDRVYLLAAGKTRGVVEAAKRAGVRGFVVLSSVSAGSDNYPGGEFHRAVERAVEESGLDWTHVRPGMFAANLLDWAESIRAEGVVREPYDSARQSPVHERDVAAVATTALVSDGHSGCVHALSGPETLSKSEQVAAISQGIGRAVRFEELAPRQWRERVGEQMPPGVPEFLLGLWERTVPHPEPVLPTIPHLLGRPARSLAGWAADHVADFR